VSDYTPKHAAEGQEEPATTYPLLSNQTYNRLKWFTMIVLPAIGTLYFAMAHVWGLPKADEVLATVTALVTFLGIVIGFSSKTYNNSDNPAGKFDGSIDVFETEDSKKFSLNLNADPDILENKDEIVFKVNKQ